MSPGVAPDQLEALRRLTTVDKAYVAFKEGAKIEFRADDTH